MSHGAGTSSSPSLPPLNTANAYSYTPQHIIPRSAASDSLSPSSPQSPQSARTIQSSGLPPPPRRRVNVASAANASYESIDSSLGRTVSRGSGSDPSQWDSTSDDAFAAGAQVEGQTQTDTFGDGSDLGQLRTQVFKRFDKIEGDVKAGFRTVDERFAQVDKRLYALDQKIDQKFQYLDNKIDMLKWHLERKLDISKLEFQELLATQMKTLQDHLLTQLEQRFQHMDQRMEQYFGQQWGSGTQTAPAPPLQRLAIVEPHASEESEIQFRRPASSLLTYESTPRVADSSTAAPSAGESPSVGQPTIASPVVARLVRPAVAHPPADEVISAVVQAVEGEIQAAETAHSNVRSLMKTIRRTLSTKSLRKKRDPNN
ncbi:hypothetical protein OBBRIDRAFT_244078 [Obba rivulosa]|uniref:Uncharacterized protein n=1 Tax=Obba rivulosa TaxID=1052685 RepID=A0A8E2AN59_9APHY|nr:hypothetical protein OBBRIDRAFT_244078 [Obba rivulosa]